MMIKCSKTIIGTAIFFVLLTGFGHFSVQAEEYEGINEGIKWSYDTETKTLTFEGEGKIPDLWCYEIGNYTKKPEWDQYSNKTRQVIVKEGITEIGHGSFQNMMKLKKVQLSDTVTRIDSQAFAYNSNLQEINLPCNLTKIESIAFHQCSKLKKITIPDSVKSIEDGAFAECTRLEKVNGFENVSEVDEFLFYKCTALKEIKLSSKLTEVSAGLFYECSNLKNIVIPDSVKTICNQAFYGTAISKIILPKKLIRLGQKAKSTKWKPGKEYDWDSGIDFNWKTGMFDSCPNLKTIIIKSDKITKVDKNTFKGLNQKVTVKIPKAKKKGYKKLFQKAKLSKSAKLVTY